MKTLMTMSRLIAGMCAMSGPAVASENPPQPPLIDLAKQPTLFVVGYAHLDTQWRWGYPQTIREFIPATLHDNFALFEKYPDYIFNFSGSRRYEMMKEYYPEDYEKLKAYIAAGRWFPCGSSVDENDANVPSAESLVRQVLYGNRFFRREFGIASDEYMLPDCFGFPAALPSVLAHCGIKGFSTQKLTWGSAVGVPFKVGVWQGPDGRSVIAALDPGAYVGEVRDDLSASESWLTRVQNNGALSGVFADYHYYGTGDTGGAPSEKSVAMVQQSVNGTGPMKIISSQADWLFKAITPEMQTRLPHYKGEMLLTEHSAGSITSQSYMKRWNRKNELLADAAERAAVAAWWLGAEYPTRRLEAAWGLVLGSQMHDILPGTSHPKAYEYSWNDEALAANQFAAVLTDAVGTVSSRMDTQTQGTAVIVFNPLSIEREDVVEINLPWTGPAPANIVAIGPNGESCAGQVLAVENGVLRAALLVRVPSVGFVVFDVKVEGASTAPQPEIQVTERTLENHRYRVTLDEQGDVTSIYDKKANREALSAPARLALLYENPRQWPAWNMDWKDRQQPPRAYVSGPARIRIVERGPVRAALEVARETEGSTFIQTIRLAAGDAGDRVEFNTQIDWTTRERSLKASFPLSVANPTAVYDIQTGVIERPNNHAKAYENPVHQWFDLTNPAGDFGVTVMSDSKYGTDKPDDSTLRLTLLYTPGTSGGYEDQGTQDVGRHQILYAIASHQGDWRAGASPWIAARLNQPLRAFIAPKHSGPLGPRFSLVNVDNPTVMVNAIKRAEDGGAIIVRLRELTGRDAAGVRVASAGSIENAAEVDGQERRIGDAIVQDGSLIAEVHGYGLRAYALNVDQHKDAVAAPISKPIELPYNVDVVSANDNRNDGAIDGEARSFPAEQLGSSLNDAGVQFQFGPCADGQNNAVRCQGQQVALPTGEFNRLVLLAASAKSDQHAEFGFDGSPSIEFLVPSWRGYIGQWDNRVWLGEVAEMAFNWPAKFGGLEPGFIKPAEVAWFCSHHHAPAGDQQYQYCYLFKIDLDIPKGATSLRLPSNENILVLAASLVKSSRDQVTPAGPLFDTFDDRSQDAPRITPADASFTDATEVRIEPRLYGRVDSVCFTVDGSAPTAGSAKYQQPIILQQSATLRAAVLGSDGTLGPEISANLHVNDRTPPRAIKAKADIGQPTVRIAFSEPLEKQSASAASNYSIEPDVAVRSAAADAERVLLTLDSPLQPGTMYTLRMRGVKDDSPARNAIGEATINVTALSPLYQVAQPPAEQRGTPVQPQRDLPVKSRDSWTLNMFIWADAQPPNRTVIAGFGACDGKTAGGGRYICKFANGIHFWSHQTDLQSNAPLDLNRWQMITATYDGAMLRLYKDGQLLGERPANLADDESVVFVSPVDPWEKRRQFDGQVRDLTIWDIALDEVAINSLKSGMPSP